MQSALSTDWVYEVWIRHWLAEFLAPIAKENVRNAFDNTLGMTCTAVERRTTIQTRNTNFGQKNYLRLHPGHLDRLGPPRLVKGSESKQN